MGIPRDPRPDDVAWPQPEWPPVQELGGYGVVVTQFVPADAPGLFAALDHDACWEHVAGRPVTPEECGATLARAPESGRWPWVVRVDGVVVGTTSFLDVSLADARLEIGHTAYSPEVWGTDVNAACKLALLTWAFEHGFGRVQLKTDIRNVRSQRAIERLGAEYEGVLRRYQRRADATVRDTVMFSVIAEEWPAVRQRLRDRLASSPRT